MEPVNPVLSLERITKSFTGTKALDAVSIAFNAGEIHALLGENGAGKLTLIKILAGIYKADDGRIAYQGRNIEMDVSRLPLAVIHQDLGLADEMTVAENISLISGYRYQNGLISWRRTNAQAGMLLDKMNCGVDPNEKVGNLSAAEKSMVAISRALSLDARILILDEPTATLSQKDVETLFDVLHSLKQSGICIIYVTHRLDEVFRISDRVTVLRNGQTVSSKPVGETCPDDLVFDIVGRKPSDMFVRMPEVKSEKAVMEIRDLCVGSVGPVSFTLHEGEILALFGLRGAGHHEIGRCLFGALPAKSGEIHLNGELLGGGGPEQATMAGMGFLSSKRHEEGIAASFSVRENMYINPRNLVKSRLSLMNLGQERLRCREAIRRFSVKTPNSEAAIGILSGGNQQKVVLARLFEAKARIMILEEPTTGVDVGSKSDIYQMMREALAEKNAILLISSDNEEVSRICHRALVFSRGRIAGEIGRDAISDSLLTSLAGGGGESLRMKKDGENA